MPPDSNIKQFLANRNTVTNPQQVTNIPQDTNLPQVNRSNLQGTSNIPQGEQVNIFAVHVQNLEL